LDRKDSPITHLYKHISISHAKKTVKNELVLILLFPKRTEMNSIYFRIPSILLKSLSLVLMKIAFDGACIH
jgi:hypothetical protein